MFTKDNRDSNDAEELLQAITDLRDEFREFRRKIDGRFEGLRTELRDFRDEIDSRFDSLRENATRLETERLFDRTIGRSAFRPEPRRMEPSGDDLVEYPEHFTVRPSPYRR